jgi:hypothetical protein
MLSTEPGVPVETSEPESRDELCVSAGSEHSTYIREQLGTNIAESPAKPRGEKEHEGKRSSTWCLESCLASSGSTPTSQNLTSRAPAGAKGIYRQ